MRQAKTTTALLASALLLASAAFSASALDIKIGGSDGNTVASVGSDTGTGTGNGNVAITTNNGQLATLGNDGTKTVGGTVNLGGAIGLVPSIDGVTNPTPTPGPTPGPGGKGIVVVGASGSPAAYDDPALRNRCKTVVAFPREYDADLVRLCMMLVKMKPDG